MIATYSPLWISMSIPETAWISWSPMTYVLRRSQVRMIIPSRFSAAPRSTLSRTAACAIFLIGDDDRRRPVIDLDARPVADGANHLVTAGDDLLVFVEAAQNLDIGRSRNPGIHLAEFRAPVADHEHALQLL